MSQNTSLRIAFDYPIPEIELQPLRDALAHHKLLFYGEMVSEGCVAVGDPSFRLEDADVIYGQPDADLVLSARNLRWVELSSAGYTRYDNDEVRQIFQERGIVLTNSSRVYDEPCAQHLAAMILAFARDLPGCLENQRNSHAWPTKQERSAHTRLLNGQMVLIYGFGAIARRLVEILAPLRMRLIGVRRTIRGDEGIPMIGEQEADTMLGEADHIVNILPDNASTRAYFDAARFARFKHGARLYNIGRGTTVDQDALLAALQARTGIDAAYLDVANPEPLPPAHPLWSAPNCYLTPHFGGGHSEENWRLIQHFLANLRAFQGNGEMVDQVY